MSRFEVEPEELSSLATSLGQFASAGNDARAALGAVTQQQTGHAGLAEAVGGFVSDWEFALKKIGENAAAMANKVGVAGQGYQQTEDAITNAAAGSAPAPTPAEQ
jgi:hypothetical protein